MYIALPFQSIHRWVVGLGLLALAAGASPVDAQPTSTETYDLSVQEQPLDEALQRVVRQTGLNLIYDPARVEGLTVSCTIEEALPSSLLRCLLEGTGLRARLLRTGTFTIERARPSSSERHTVSGFVRDAETGEALVGASVYVPQRAIGAATNAYGFFSLTLRSDTATVRFSHIGYQTKRRRLDFAQGGRIEVTLTPEPVALDSIEVVGAPVEPVARQTRLSTYNVPVERIEAMPTLLGEVDVLRALQYVPGVQMGSEGSAGLYVRGGERDQNLILLDGAPVYNAYHVFGFLSMFNADAIHDVELITGGFPARYGGRLSSVLDLRTKEGNRNAYDAKVGVGMITTQGVAEGPLPGADGSFLVAGRRSIAGDIAEVVAPNAYPDANFYDVNAKVNLRVSSQDRLFLSLYGGSDRFQDGEVVRGEVKEGLTTRNERAFRIGWSNALATLRWNRLIGEKMFSNVMLLYSEYDYETLDRAEQSEDGEIVDANRLAYTSGLQDVGAQIDLDYLPNPRHHVRIGGQVVRHEYEPGRREFMLTINRESVQDTTLAPNDRVTATEWAAYAEDDVDVSRRLRVNAGLRASGYVVNGTHYVNWQPRFASRLLVNEWLSWKASYARMAQYVHQLSNSGLGLPTDRWVPSTPRVAPEGAHQVTTGFAASFDRGYEARLEGYAKWMDGLLEYAEGASYASGRDWQTRVETGAGRSVGAELMLQKTRGRTTGGLSYTLSRTTRTFEDINAGETFPFRYDHRHNLSLHLTHRLSDRWQVSAAWAYRTGSAVTFPSTVFLSQTLLELYSALTPGRAVEQYDERNGYRMPAYHRLDLSLQRTFETDWGAHQLRLGIYNTYNRHNPYFMYLDSEQIPDAEGDAPRYRRVARVVRLLPILPSLHYAVSF